MSVFCPNHCKPYKCKCPPEILRHICLRKAKWLELLLLSLTQSCSSEIGMYSVSYLLSECPQHTTMFTKIVKQINKIRIFLLFNFIKFQSYFLQKKSSQYYLITTNAMSKRQSGSNSSKVAFFKVPVIFGIRKGFSTACEWLYAGFFIYVLSPGIDSN